MPESTTSVSDRRLEQLQQYAVSASQMTDLEDRVFAAGMPVAALMEKVAGRIAARVKALYSPSAAGRVGLLVGPGHNGGDALVVARELHFSGYDVVTFCPFTKLKQLTEQHARYARSLGIPQVDQVEALVDCGLLIDGLFGYGLTRSLEGAIATQIDQINRWHQPVLSIDIPSGLQTDTGAVLGTAIRASRTFCLGLWKRAFLQDQALEYTGVAELIDFDLPLADVTAVLNPPPVQRITARMAIAALPLPRSPISHKYAQGHLLLICGSTQYPGAAILSALSARASGVGMLSIAVPESLQSLVIAQVPDALVIRCPETQSGAIAHLPDAIHLEKYQAIACGPGLTPAAAGVVQQVLTSPCPLVLDADGLNILARETPVNLRYRSAPTVLTPHPGEFKRLFPDLVDQMGDRLEAVRTAAQQSGAVVLLKGARVAIAAPDQPTVWVNPESTPALARGGSGDVLTGLMGGLLAQLILREIPVESGVKTATWWHAQSGIFAAQNRSELGVDASTLTQSLIPALSQWK